MSSSSAHSRLACRGLATAALLVVLSFGGVGYAEAATTVTANSTQAEHFAMVFGVPLSTAAWAVLGLTLMITGLVASSRSNRRPLALQVVGASVSPAGLELNTTPIRKHTEPSAVRSRVSRRSDARPRRVGKA